MTTQLHKAKTYTVEEYIKLPDNGKRYELIEGELIEMPGPNINHGRLTNRLAVSLTNYITNSGQNLGEIFSNMAVILSSKTAPLPDVVFISAEKINNFEGSQVFSGAPDLAIEVISPTDKWSEIIDKVRLYHSYQVTLVWVVDPFDKAVLVFRPNQSRRSLFIGDDLTGEEIIPGFTLPVKDLFA